MTWKALFAAFVVLSMVASPALSQAPPDSEKAKQVVALVEKAAAMIESKGKAAFPDFRKTGSEWWVGDTYLFAGDMKGRNCSMRDFPIMKEPIPTA